MGGIRVSQRLLIDRVLNNLGSQTQRLLRLQEQLSTQLRVNRPSDDPLAARRAINARDEISKNAQFLTNISSIAVNFTDTETSILNVNSQVIRVKELALQGVNNTNGPAQREQFAVEINQIIESVLQQTNNVSNGRYIFGGTRTNNPPFVATRNANNEVISVAYEGNDEKISAEVSDGVYVNVNETGQDVFLSNTPTTVNVLDVLIGIRDNLRSGNVNPVQDQIGQLDQARDQLLAAASRSGSLQNRVEGLENNIRDIDVQLKAVLSDSIDADYAEVVVELNAESNAYQAALSASARVIQPSLLDYLR